MVDLAGVRFLLFRVGDVTCAIAAGSVVEILSASPVTRIPGTPSGVLGMINVRGQLVTLVDGGRVTGDGVGRDHQSVVLLEADGRSIGLGVTEVLDLVPVLQEDIAEREDLTGMDSRFVRGVARCGGDTCVVVDAEALLNWVLPRGE